MPRGSEAIFIQPTTPLRDKVRAGKYVGSPIAEMEQVIEQMLPEYERRAQKDIDVLSELHAELERDQFNEELRNKIFRLSHDMKGQGGTFGYDLITTIGNDLCRFIEKPIPLDDGKIKVIGHHIRAMKLIFEKKMTEHGNGQGKKIVTTLREMVSKAVDHQKPIVRPGPSGE